MIKFMSTLDSGRKLFGIILTDNDWELLKKDLPIHFSAEDLGLAEFKYKELVIAYSPTDEEFVEIMKNRGRMDEDTIINIVVEHPPKSQI